jgi:hypothetical protein
MGRLLVRALLSPWPVSWPGATARRPDAGPLEFGWE